MINHNLAITAQSTFRAKNLVDVHNRVYQRTSSCQPRVSMRQLVFGVLLLLLSVFTTEGLDDVARYAEQLAKQRLFAGMLHVDQGKVLKTPQRSLWVVGGAEGTNAPTQQPYKLQLV